MYYIGMEVKQGQIHEQTFRRLYIVRLRSGHARFGTPHRMIATGVEHENWLKRIVRLGDVARLAWEIDG
jgi:hypothetical protein